MQKVSVFEVLYYIPKYLHSATAFFQTVFQQYFMVKQRFPPQYLKAFQVLHHHTSWRSADRVFIEKKLQYLLDAWKFPNGRGDRNIFLLEYVPIFSPSHLLFAIRKFQSVKKISELNYFFYKDSSRSSTCAGLDVGKSHLTIKRL